mmetsp:Transcript_43180/g.108079  ORF Transcript_43180/g.108079 Transcript_43180/m.108079 type:complete len:219 (+) Transcript_43180:398-1054(+)
MIKERTQVSDMPETPCPSTDARTSPTTMRPSLAAALPAITSSTMHSPPSMPCTKNSPTPALLLWSSSCFRPDAGTPPVPLIGVPPGDLLSPGGCCNFPLACTTGSIPAPLTASTLQTGGSTRQLSVDSQRDGSCPSPSATCPFPRCSKSAPAPCVRNDECGTPATTSRPRPLVPTLAPLCNRSALSLPSLRPPPFSGESTLADAWVPGAASATSLHDA